MMRATCGLALALAFSAPVWADSQLDAPDTARYLRWGAVRVRPGFAVSNLGYDNNILLSSDERKVGDFTATLSPRLAGLVLLGKSAFLTFDERLNYRAYASHSDQNYLDNHTSARITFPLRRRYGVYAELGYDLTNQRPIDLEDIRPERKDTSGGFGVILEPRWRTEIDAGLTFNDIRYDDPDFDPAVGGRSIGERLDRYERGTKLDVRYRVRGRTRIVFKGLVKAIAFDHPFVDPGSGETLDRDTREWRVMSGVEFGEGGSLRGTMLVGWDHIGAQANILQDLSEPVGEAQVSYRLNSRTRFELEGERLPGFAIFGFNSYYLYRNINLRTVYFFSRTIGLEVGAGPGKLTFPDSINLAGREDRLMRYLLGVRLRLMQNSAGRRVEYSFRINYYDRTSNLEQFDRNTLTAGFGAVLGY